MPERARFCFIPWQHLLKTENITGGVCGPRSLGDKTGATSHPSTSWPAWTFPCWPLAIESLFPSSKGLISAVCPMALSTAGPLWNTMWLQGMRWRTLTAAQHHSKDIMLGGDTDTNSEAGEVSPGPLQKMHPQYKDAFLHPARDLLWQQISGRVVSASSLQDRSTVLQTLSCCSSTPASGWLLQHATVRREDTFSGCRRHFVQVKCRV